MSSSVPDPADGIAEFLLAQYRDLENAIETEVETGAPLYAFPEQLLADVESKRRIVALHQTRYAGDPDWQECLIDGDSWPCRTLELLAAPFRGVPGWRNEWAIED